MFKNKQKKQIVQIPSALELLTKQSPFRKSLEERADMTITCRDTDYIPKVPNAGKVIRKSGMDVQIMHNGVAVKRGGYYGDWMERIIKDLRGHHEPQEEKIFHELLKQLQAGSTMIELGAFWSYYSLWFHNQIPNAVNICCEPDPNNRQVGMTNAKLNSAELTFIEGAAGEGVGNFIDFPLESQPGELRRIPILAVDTIFKEQKLKKLDILHMDVQGAELAAIRGAANTIKQGKLRFLLVSTHHYSISGDPQTHFKCLELIRSLGGHIIADHTVLESFSGDGLIAASFSKQDRDIEIDISINSTSNSLYEPYENDLALLIGEYDKLRTQL